MSPDRGIRHTLRELPSIVGQAPVFDPSTAPEEPGGLVIQWLLGAIEAGVPEPHAVTLATTDEHGPDARVLILKDVDTDGTCAIATGDESAKGRQLRKDQRCALSIYWSPLARAIRIRGLAQPASDEDSAEDFLARGHRARAIALAGHQSAHLTDRAEREWKIDAAMAAIDQDPEIVDPAWSVWRIQPESIEFWQGDPSRSHHRLRYTREADGWLKQELWP